MKQFSRIISAMMVLILLLSIEATAQTQKYSYPQVKQNSDGSYDQFEVIKAFELFVDTVKKLPITDTTDKGIEEYVGNFFYYLPGIDEYNTVVIRIGDSNTSELDSIEYAELAQDCRVLLKKKIEQNAATQNSNQLKKPKDFQKKMPTSYTKLALWIGLPIGIVLILVVIILFVIKSKKKNKAVGTENRSSVTFNPANSSNNVNTHNDIIIRQKTSSVMYKQSLEGVVNNGNYMVIDCSNFSNDTAVKTMYIKNSCIMDIYNMYAEDLRNPNNPKEDGCMVLGRWVHDEKTDEYAVSLEEVVFPGDDAVFAEYELDFGGKIKVKVNEKLRKLRRETNLQYDLTCWVHSHPGLGVFFSNTDCSLHLLHKHPTHTKFLTAIVIDILTPQQELGIFTFKHDLSINSKADLKQLYSLEEWYKWAVESKRTSVVVEEHYNTVENAKSRNNKCYNIQLSNSTIIDMDLIANNPNRQSLYFVHGFSTEQSDQISNIADKIESTDSMTNNDLVGCFMTVTHRSYPTIKKAVEGYLDKIKFVLVYSTANGVLTSIPVIANDLCSDESYYGEQPLEDLKIWTRRKR